jgi:hypothetical protein
VARLSHDVMASDAPQPCEKEIPVAKAHKVVLPSFPLVVPTFWNSQAQHRALPYLRRTQIKWSYANQLHRHGLQMN